MINPVNQIIQQRYLYSKPTGINQKKTYHNQAQDLSGYQVSLGILARNNISFKQQKRIVPNSFCCNLAVVDELIPPYITVEITNNDKNPTKQGLKGIYIMLMNGAIFSDENNKLAEFIASGVDIKNRGLALSCAPNDVSKVIKMIDSDFINTDIKESNLETAKQIASVWLFLSRKTDDYKKEFDDIPADMPEVDYEKLISEFTIEDIQKLNADIIKNSDININIVINKKDYMDYQEEIDKSIKMIEY